MRTKGLGSLIFSVAIVSVESVFAAFIVYVTWAVGPMTQWNDHEPMLSYLRLGFPWAVLLLFAFLLVEAWFGIAMEFVALVTTPSPKAAAEKS